MFSLNKSIGEESISIDYYNNYDDTDMKINSGCPGCTENTMEPYISLWAES